jgi:hypothetical protein
VTPSELKRLQLKAGMSNKEIADQLHISEKRWMNLKSVNSKEILNGIQYELLLMLSGEHPVYELKKKI